MEQWSDVTLSELGTALREAELAWAPSSEFLRLGRFNLPLGPDSVAPRLKCNLWCYRANYAVLLVLALVAATVRRPASLLAIAILLLGAACLSDVLARNLSQRTTRLIRKVNPHLAERLRADSAGRTGLGAPGKGGANIVGAPRAVVVAACGVLALLILWRAGSLRRVAWALAAGCGLVLAHAALRAPNLKARLATQARAREEFRAVWRGYAAGHDYNA